MNRAKVLIPLTIGVVTMVTLFAVFVGMQPRNPGTQSAVYQTKKNPAPEGGSSETLPVPPATGSVDDAVTAILNDALAEDQFMKDADSEQASLIGDDQAITDFDSSYEEEL